MSLVLTGVPEGVAAFLRRYSQLEVIRLQNHVQYPNRLSRNISASIITKLLIKTNSQHQIENTSMYYLYLQSFESFDTMRRTMIHVYYPHLYWGKGTWDALIDLV